MLINKILFLSYRAKYICFECNDFHLLDKKIDNHCFDLNVVKDRVRDIDARYIEFLLNGNELILMANNKTYYI